MLNKKELELMQILWHSERPLTKSEIVNASVKKKSSWKESSVYNLLNRLIEMNMINEVGYLTNMSKRPTRLFAPTVSFEEYYANEITQYSSNIDMAVLFSKLIKKSSLSEDTLEKILTIIEDSKGDKIDRC